MKPEEFDAQFLRWLNEQHAAALKGFEEWTKSMKPMNAAVRAKQWDEVLKAAPKLLACYPEYVEAGNAYEALAEARLAGGDKRGASEALSGYARQGGRDPAVLKKLAGLQSELNDPAAAEATLRRLLWIYPVKDEDLHRQLAVLRGRLGRWPDAVEEWRAVLESAPADKASAYYELALAYRRTNRLEEARDAVLSALEEAPGYRAAQKLLLELNPPAAQERK
jgi:tetratricopeptide (TPR) repeat protein